MKTNWHFTTGKSSYLLILGFILFGKSLFAQSPLSPYVIFGGQKDSFPSQRTPLAPGYGVQIGSTNTIQGGSIGSYHLVKSAGLTAGTISNPTNIYSWGIIQLTNSPVVTGKITAANQYTLPSLLPEGSVILSVGSSAVLGSSSGGDIAVRGSIGITGGSVLGKVTIPPDITPPPAPAITYTYSGPTIPTPGLQRAVLTFPTFHLNDTAKLNGLPYSGFSSSPSPISTSQKIRPNISYGNITLNGNKTLTFDGPGIYVINSITNSGTSNNFVFNFKNKVGTIRVYVRGNVDLGKIKASLDSVISYGGGPALGESRVYLETQGRGVSAANPVAFSIANGSAGSASKWVGTVYAPFAAINIGSGTGSTNLTGALWSGTQVNLQSGIYTTFAPFTFCDPTAIDAGPDRPLDFSNVTRLSDTLHNATKYSWRTTDGIIISDTSKSFIYVSSAGTYILTADSAGNCYARDTVKVTSKLKSLIGSELQSIYDNKTTDNTFFDIQNGFVMIDVIVNTGYKKAAYDSLIKPFYGLNPDTLPNGTSPFIITGKFPVSNLPKINNLFVQINYCMPHNYGVTYNGFSSAEEDTVVRSGGDTAIRSYLVRKGYNLTGKEIKIGIISNSFNTIANSDLIGPIITYNEQKDREEGELPDINKPYTFSKRVKVLKDLVPNPPRTTDEGRAMAQLIHDVAPGAELYFHTGSVSAGNFADGIRKLDSAGCKIIVDDITYITEPFLKNGVVANAVDTAAKHGVSYFSAAGNFANWSYEKNFNAVAAPLNVGFAVGAKAHNFGSSTTDIYDSVTFLPGSYTIVLQWVDDIHSIGQGGTIHDLDVYLTPKNDGTARFGFNRDNTGGDPIEFISFTTTDIIETNILIVNNNTTIGSNPSRVKIVIYRGTKNSFRFNENMTDDVVTSTITGQSNAEGAITIGAARYNKTDSIEYFSSIGGRTVVNKNGLPSPRYKPDLTGPDGGSTTVKMGTQDINGDGYYDFFGTSAAAPHAAAVAALLMEGRGKFLAHHPATSTPDTIRAMLDSAATDMYATLNLPASGKFDFNSGHGFLNADVAMRTIAEPTPNLIDLVGPPYTPNVVPGIAPITLTITGENFSESSVVILLDTANNINDTISPLTISTNMLTVEIGTFTGTPEVFVYTPPKTLFGDGGNSNSLNFFDADVVVKVLSDTITYGQPIPVFNLSNTIITVNDTLLQNSNRTLESLGLANMTFRCDATAISDAGSYDIIAVVDSNNLSPNFNYKLIRGKLRIEQLSVRITALNIDNAIYGEQLPNIQYSYEILNTSGISNPDSLLNVIRTSHHNSIAIDPQTGNDILGLVNEQAVTIENDQAVVIENNLDTVVIEKNVGYVYKFNAPPDSSRLIINSSELVIDTIINGQDTTYKVIGTNGYKLTSNDISNLSFLASAESLSDLRTVLSNQVIDITEESILWFKKNSGLTYMLSSVSNTDRKGLVGVNSYVNEQAIVIENDQAVTIENDQAVVIENDQAVTIENDQAVTIENDQAVVIENGVRIPIVDDEKTAVIVDSVEIGGRDGPSNLKSLAVVTGLEPGQHFIIPAALPNSLPGSPSGSSFGNNFKVNYVPGILTITDPCLLTRAPFNNFGSTVKDTITLWVNVAVKVSGQLKTDGRYLLFRGGDITLNDIVSIDLATGDTIKTKDLPDGKLIADKKVKNKDSIYTKFINNTWETHIPVGFSSISDIFISGAIINSSTGFIKTKKNANSNTVVRGVLISDTVYSDQWTYALATYNTPVQYPAKIPSFNYTSIADSGDVVPINGINGTSYRAGTPLPHIAYLVNGASGGGGRNYTGSTSSFDNFTACCPTCPPAAALIVSSPAVQKKNNEVAETISPAGDVRIIPNPASDYVNLSFVPAFTGNSKIAIYMIDGIKVYETNNGIFEAGKTYMKKIDVSKLVNGIYIVQLTGKDKTTIRKIIISR